MRRKSGPADTPGLLAQALAALGFLSAASGQHAESREYLEEARQIADELGAEKLSARIATTL